MGHHRTDDPQLLHRRWTRSHEEDTAEALVFRPADYPFPPSRGRISYELKPDGELLYEGIGPTDRPSESAGNWKLEEDGHSLALDVPGQVEQTLEIEQLSEDRLVVKRPGAR